MSRERWFLLSPSFRWLHIIPSKLVFKLRRMLVELFRYLLHLAQEVLFLLFMVQHPCSWASSRLKHIILSQILRRRTMHLVEFLLQLSSLLILKQSLRLSFLSFLFLSLLLQFLQNSCSLHNPPHLFIELSIRIKWLWVLSILHLSSSSLPFTLLALVALQSILNNELLGHRISHWLYMREGCFSWHPVSLIMTWVLSWNSNFKLWAWSAHFQ